MIKKETLLKVTDNTGAKKVKCIHVYKKKTGKIGDIILISVKSIKLKYKTKIKKGSLHKALLIRTKSKKKTKTNEYINFNENSVILLNNQKMPMGTRILGPVPSTLRNKKNLKIISMASHII